MTTWKEACDQIRNQLGYEVFVDYLQKTAVARAEYRFTGEQSAALERHGYASAACPRGVGGGTDVIWFRGHRIILRNRVCYLDGIEIDGHESSDLDPGCGCCLHCDYECSSCASC